MFISDLVFAFQHRSYVLFGRPNEHETIDTFVEAIKPVADKLVQSRGASLVWIAPAVRVDVAQRESESCISVLFHEEGTDSLHKMEILVKNSPRSGCEIKFHGVFDGEDMPLLA